MRAKREKNGGRGSQRYQQCFNMIMKMDERLYDRRLYLFVVCVTQLPIIVCGQYAPLTLTCVEKVFTRVKPTAKGKGKQNINETEEDPSNKKRRFFYGQ
jgi:hypothetical protein